MSVSFPVVMASVVGDAYAPDPGCPCGHTEASHDAIASRYCRASRGAVLARGCVCRPGSALNPSHPA